jgi:predicted acylesterase/phospholipase RssA
VPENPFLASEAERPTNFGERFKFHEVFWAETALINRRRQDNARGTFQLEQEAPHDVSGERVLRPPLNANVVGLALSGGGIRSAAFCLGVLQALHQTRVLNGVDYLSTVSGGGYIGCALTAALEQGGRNGDAIFPFASELHEDEPPALQHVRDYSNYLFPYGAIDLLYNASIYVRGLVVNVLLVAPFLLGASALTLFFYAVSADSAMSDIFKTLNIFGFSHFAFTADLALLLVGVGVVWGLVQSWWRRVAQPEMPGLWTHWVGWLVIVLVVAAFCEAQSFVLDAMLQESFGRVSTLLSNWINAISAALAPVAAVIASLASKIGEYLKSMIQSPKMTAQITGVVLKVAIYLVGFIVPFLLWVIYLDLSYWGLCINPIACCSCSAPRGLDTLALTVFHWAEQQAWLVISAHAIFRWLGQPAWLGNIAHDILQPVTVLYFAVGLTCFVLSLFLRPNANSLHPLYRDRLGRAFLFKLQAQLRRDQKLERWRPRFREFTGRYGPYHLINVALNVQDSKTANRRGRNADFFIFSKKFVGSKSTDYVATRDVEDVAVGFDVATAMAASGAAVSSNMGAESIKPLTATLALLNIRLGYWLRNPLRLVDAKPPTEPPTLVRGSYSEFRRRRNLLANYYFVAEIFGRLSEKRKSVYLTDGGHIENLGIYELLRRRCAVIIAVDAEADPQMAFGSFNTLERYALIDLGVRIDLPWQKIANESLATSQAIDKVGNVTVTQDEAGNVSQEKTSDVPKDHGPHCAIGEITYPGRRKGILVYIKASLTGDENDTVFDYKKRYSAFPHETTLDQMFTEEQFEAYRALGFHAAYRLFDRSDNFAHLDPGENPKFREQVDLLDQLFPRVKPVKAEDPPAQKQTFAVWLDADKPAAKRPLRRRTNKQSDTAAS